MRRGLILIVLLLTFSNVPSSQASQIDGTFETSLGTDGYVDWNTNFDAGVGQILPLNDAKILHFGSIQTDAAGERCARAESRAVAYKTDPAGVIDVDFGNFGTFERDQYPRNFFVAADEASDGSIYLLGVGQNITEISFSNGWGCTPATERVFVVKLQPNGVVDNSFGVWGYRDIEIENPSGFPTNLLVIEDGTILVTFSEGEVFDLLLINADGSTNMDFGIEGLVKLSQSNMRVFKAIQAGSRIILFGDKFSPEDDGVNRWAISDIDLSGSELGNFRGEKNFEYSSGRKEGIFISPQYLNQNIYIVAGVLSGSIYEIQALKISESGQKDLQYGGYLRSQLMAIGVTPCGYCSGEFTLDSYGRVLISIGTDTISNGKRQSAIVRLDQDGLIDSSFGENGKIWINYDPQAGVQKIDENRFMIYGSLYSSENCVSSVCGLSKLYISQFHQLPKNSDPLIIDVNPKVGEFTFTISNYETQSTYTISNNVGQFSLDSQNGGAKVGSLGLSSRLVTVEVRSSKSGFGDGKRRISVQTLDSEVVRRANERNAEKLREIEKKAAREEILALIGDAKVIDLATFGRAAIAGVTPKNISEVQAEILGLSEEYRSDIKQVLRIARKFEVVDKVASSDRIYSSMLQEVGLISQDSKHKAALTAALRKLPASERTSYLAIKQAIDVQMAEIQTRKTRLSEVMGQIAARRKG
jgi:hypothetical protein